MTHISVAGTLYKYLLDHPTVAKTILIFMYYTAIFGENVYIYIPFQWNHFLFLNIFMYYSVRLKEKHTSKFSMGPLFIFKFFQSFFHIFVPYAINQGV